jgi:putative tricarboxylic transport membrane protein
VDVFADLGQGILALLTVQNVLLLGAGVLLGWSSG